LAGAAGALRREVARLAERMPLPGEPAEIYVLRSRIRSDDLRTASVAMPHGRTIWVAFIDSIVDASRMESEVLRPLQELAAKGELPKGAPEHPLLPRARALSSLDEWATDLLAGRAVVFSPGVVVSLDIQAFPHREVGEPSTEQTLLGSKEAFTEDARSNIGAIRHRLQDERLRVETFVVGRRSRTQVALVYLADVVNPDVLDLTRSGLSAIDTDAIRTANDISEFLYNQTLTTIPLSEQTEKPDRVASAIAAGRLCLVVDGTPFALLVPTTFFENVKDGEVALSGAVSKGFVRLLRLLGMFTAISSGGLYAAVMTSDSQILPTPLAVAVSNSRTGVPYPVLTETLLMLLVIDIFSEATAQSPGGIGNTLSIVGTLIIGQMAVQARLASSLMLIVIAATALGSFLTLKYPFSYTLRIWKYPITILAGIAGLFGWMLGLLLFLTHLASLKSAGVPYLSPLAPLKTRTLLRTTVTDVARPAMDLRPESWNVRDIDRAGRWRL